MVKICEHLILFYDDASLVFILRQIPDTSKLRSHLGETNVYISYRAQVLKRGLAIL